jgi:DNA polymerase-3 subunit epsilon/ATP-dependent DNA helicase DinG
VNRLATAFAAIHDQIPDAGLAADLAAAQRDARDLFRGLDRIVADPKPDDVTWVSRGGRERLALHRAPLYVGDLLARRLFGDKETVVLTSATLRAGDDFELVRDRLGLQDGDAAVVASPFDYAAASLLYIPNDIPEPGEAGYGRAVQGALAELAVAVGGRTLVLFTSHSELRAAYHAIRGPLGERGISVLGQGLDGSRTSLLSGFRDPNVKSMLLGTRSFWEGIDVPGPALSCLVIARLPFEVPTDPVFAARSETFDEPFYDYAVPRAVLRFRQGFGRLIRTVQDRGVVIVLDRRALTKPYGRVFLDALPPIRRRFGPIHAAASTAERFLAGEPIGPDAPVGLPEGPAWYNGPSGLAGDRNRPTDDWRNDRD